MVLAPPGSAKSVYCSQIFPAWWFAQHPASAVVGASHKSELSQSFGRRVRNLVARERDVLGYELTQDSKAAGRWETSEGGEYYAAGMDSHVTGRRADLLVVDDPVSGLEAAQNQNMRDKVWDHYRAEFLPRLKPDARIVVIMTRWHEDDLGGRLLAEMGSGGDEWRVVSLSAIAEDPATSDETRVVLPDPLGRAPGEPLWPEWESLEALERKRRDVGELFWSALYQQRPVPPTGAIFDVDKMPTLDAFPDHGPRSGRAVVRAWDLGATEQQGRNDPDWTRGLKLLRLPDDRYAVLDVVSTRGGPAEVEALITRTAEADGPHVKVRLPQDPGQAGKAQVSWLGGKLSGYVVKAIPVSGSKATRAAPVASQVNLGNVSMVRGPWNRGFSSELRDFPNGRHDDQVDALADAFAEIGIGRAPMRISDAALTSALMQRR